MASCASCNKMILFGGVEEQGLRFCNAHCLREGQVALAARQMSSYDRTRLVQSVYRGPCPRCKETGSIDLHQSHFVQSFILLTRWGTNELICCRRCALKRQGGDVLQSFLLGWWGIPFGILMTPIQLLRNGYAMLFPPNTTEPSEAFQRVVVERFLRQAIENQAQPTATDGRRWNE